jgi:hypothetical protein
MDMNLKDLSPGALDHLRERLLAVARGYEPWADMMMLGGAGDNAPYDFPLALDSVERIDITMEERVGHQGVLATSSP